MSRNRLPLIRLLLPIADLTFVSDGASDIRKSPGVLYLGSFPLRSTVKHSSQVVIPNPRPCRSPQSLHSCRRGPAGAVCTRRTRSVYVRDNGAG